jgi:hydrogenase maturation protease
MVVGVGNPWRRDDGAGLEVARRVGGLEHEGDCVRLVDAFAGHDDVVVVDAAAPDGVPGAIHRFAADAEPLPAAMLRSSTHAFGVSEAIELARALGRLPRTLRVYAIEGADFTIGTGLTAAVAQAVDLLARELGEPGG